EAAPPDNRCNGSHATMDHDFGSAGRKRPIVFPPLCVPMLLAVGGLLLGTFYGCGEGEYERLLNQRKERVEKAAKFNELYQPQPLEGTAVSVRIPVKFTIAP